MKPDVEMRGYVLERIEERLKEVLEDVQIAMRLIGHKKYVPPVRPDNPFPLMEIGQVVEFDRCWASWLEDRRCYQKKKHPDRKFKFKYRASKKVMITRIS